MNATKNTYRIIQRIDTYATVEVEADSPEEAIALADEQEWDYDTDFDSAVTITWDLIEEGAPDEDLFGVEFVDPYLGRDDVVWAVNAVIDDETVQAEIIASDDDSDLGTEDAYAVGHVKNFQIPS